ncbi:phosphotransferase [Rhodocytophaga rosea]|uniref:Phosphotransferase n=1 Tax=Rhodocytophaga rosea TaxID=2704465 RepID=A0A6C0GKB6_9BACT|nr:phosphotransferase [Rhodocytophaga rosea]QHT68468.1 phosphotransferase [Rhodocytophaga rosea]
MSTFPVIDSTLSPVHLAAWLIEKYNLHFHTSCRLFRTNMNHTYIVSEQEKKYILRIYSYNRRSETEITEELRLLNLLKASGIHVSYPIADKNNNLLQKIDAPEGMRHVVLFSFGEGHKIRNLTQELSYSIGSLLANMHTVTLHQPINRIQYNIDSLVAKAYQQAKLYISESLEEMKFIQASAEVLHAVFEASAAPDIRRGIVHLDVWYDNMSITDAGKITLFDFDNCGNGWLVLDIGYFCMQLFYTQPDKKEYECKLQSFLDGYRTITSIPEEEIQLIPYAGLAIWIYYLGVQAERFDNFSNIFFTENYVKMYIGKVKEWVNYHHINIHTAAIC